jgi:hypothetical protein
MSTKSKNILLLIIVLLVVGSMFTIVIYDAVMANKEVDEVEIFIDSSPIDYTSDESAIYAFKFTSSVTSIATSIGFDSSNSKVQSLIKKLLSAMSYARIPSIKLGLIADVLSDRSDDIAEFLSNSSSLTDEQFAELIQVTKMQYIADFINDFLDESTLNEDELSNIIYQFMLSNANTEYKTAMENLGKEDYITFISSTIYLICTLGDFANGTVSDVSSTVLQAVIYELGSNYINILDTAGLDAIETILGFDWSYTIDGVDSETYNTYANEIADKLSYCFGLIGYMLKSLTITDIDTILKYSQSEDENEINDYLILTQQIIAKSMVSGMVSSMKYIEDEVDNVLELYPYLKQMLLDTYTLSMLVSGSEIDDEVFTIYSDAVDDFTNKVLYFSVRDLDIEDLQSLYGTDTYDELLSNATDMNNIRITMDDFMFNVIFLWGNNLLNGGELA